MGRTGDIRPRYSQGTRWERRRCFVSRAAFAVLFVLGAVHAAEVAHSAAVPHSICFEHGKPVHRTHRLADHRDHAAGSGYAQEDRARTVVPEGSAGPSEHDHCSILGTVLAGTLPTKPSVTAAPPPPPLSIEAARYAGSTGARFLIAPKHSPPRYDDLT